MPDCCDGCEVTIYEVPQCPECEALNDAPRVVMLVSCGSAVDSPASRGTMLGMNNEQKLAELRRVLGLLRDSTAAMIDTAGDGFNYDESLSKPNYCCHCNRGYGESAGGDPLYMTHAPDCPWDVAQQKARAALAEAETIK
jgi:hypothetical protein